MSSDKEYLRKFKFIAGWEFEKEEEWLNEMNLKGYKFVSMSLCVYKFEICEPKDYIYKLDFKRLKAKEFDNYIDLYKDLGWEHIESFKGWQWFRIERSKCTVSEIFTDEDSKKQMFKGFLKFFIILSLLFVLPLTIHSIILIIIFHNISYTFLLMLLLLYVEYGYFGFKLYNRYKKFKNNIL